MIPHLLGQEYKGRDGVSHLQAIGDCHVLYVAFEV